MAASEDTDYLAGLVSSPLDHYRERKRFLDFVDGEEEYELLDTVNKKKLYGVLDHEFYIVQPNLVLKSFSMGPEDIQGLNYVVDAYESFYQKYSKMISEGVTSPPDSVGDLTPVRSYVNFEESYLSYRIVTSGRILSLLLEENHGRLTFIEAVRKIMEAIFHDDFRQYNVTKTGFILSKSFSIFSTGMYIDLGQNLSAQIDLEKGKMIKHSGFDCYYKMATESGFYVDKNSPWRLIANLSSTVMRENILNGRDQSQFQNFVSDVYDRKVGLDDYWIFKSFFTQVYYSYLEQTGQVQESEDTQQNVGDLIVAQVPETEWLLYYVYTRYRELGLCNSEDFFATDPRNERKNKILNIYSGIRTRMEDPTINGLSGNHGPLAYLEKQYTNDLREVLGRQD